MKSLILLLMIMALTTAGSRGEATAWTALFQEAQAAYDAGQFDRAANLYQQLEQQGQDNATVLFNKGNALYRLGRIGAAVAAYQRALYERPRDPDVQANIRLVQQQVGALAAEPDARARFFGHLSQREWRDLGTVAYWLAAGLGALYALARARPGLKRAAQVALTVALLSAGGWWHWQHFVRQPEAIVGQPNVKALFAPMPGALVHFALPEGSRVSVRETTGAWRKIAVGRQEGWVPATACDTLSLPR
jgi:tetratricopeptide (TPR) repeat protein